jgi:hypothetical protein
MLEEIVALAAVADVVAIRERRKSTTRREIRFIAVARRRAFVYAQFEALTEGLTYVGDRIADLAATTRGAVAIDAEISRRRTGIMLARNALIRFGRAQRCTKHWGREEHADENQEREIPHTSHLKPPM